MSTKMYLSTEELELEMLRRQERLKLTDTEIAEVKNTLLRRKAFQLKQKIGEATEKVNLVTKEKTRLLINKRIQSETHHAAKLGWSVRRWYNMGTDTMNPETTIFYCKKNVGFKLLRIKTEYDVDHIRFIADKQEISHAPVFISKFGPIYSYALPIGVLHVNLQKPEKIKNILI